MIKDVNLFCQLFYSMTYIPVAHFKQPDALICAYPSPLASRAIIQQNLAKTVHFQRPLDYTIMQSSGMLGLVTINGTAEYLVIGPVFPVQLTPSLLREFLMECHLPKTADNQLNTFIGQVPQMSFLQFLQTLAYMQLCLNDDVLDIKQYFHIENNTMNEELIEANTTRNYVKKEHRAFHTTVAFEQEMYDYVSHGEVAKLNHLLLNKSYGLATTVTAQTNLRQLKNIVIGIATLASRHAINGGLDADTAYTLADTYIFKGERLTDPLSVHQLQYSLLMDFAKKVQTNQISPELSPTMHQCVQFVKNHTNEPITLGDVAANIHRSTAYTSKKFRQELGMSFSAFKQQCRLNEAKILLTYTDKSLFDISNYLCFFDQPYFQHVFKKAFGITPDHYRKQFNDLPTDRA